MGPFRICSIISSVLVFLSITNLGLAQETHDHLPPTELCLTGDSHFEPSSNLVRHLRTELGSEYRVIAFGRRGWTTRRWVRHLDLFVSQCRSSDVVLISLGGNDRVNGFAPDETRANLDLLLDAFSEIIYEVYHITRPSDHYRGEYPEYFYGDGIHLNERGAEDYAQILSDRFIR